jgi:hypothetical protein
MLSRGRYGRTCLNMSLNMASPTGDEDALQHTYVLVVSFQKARTRWRIKATGINATRCGRMLDLRDQEKIQMRKQG